VILITGASGQIGSYIFESLADREEVIGVDLRECTAKDLRDFFVLGDLRDEKLAERLVRDADVIIHLAAQVSVEKSWEDPFFDAENNLIATLNLLKFCDGQKFIYFSSAAVYGDPVYVPIDEEHPKNPMSPYGVSKLSGEYYCRVFSEKVEPVIIRPFNVFSSRMDPKSPYSGVISKFISRVKQGLPPVIFGDGKQTRDFVHVRDVVEFVKIAMKRGKSCEAYNVGTGKETSILDLAKMILEIANLDLEPVFSKPRKGDIRRSCANIEKAKNIGFEPKTNLRKDLERILENA
jgi:UDP-glucose 4-epimerase